MARPIELKIVQHVSIDELDSIVNETERADTPKKQSKVMLRLQFIRLRYKGYTVEEASSIVGFTTKTGYNVQKSWNSDGVDGIVPNYKGGPKPKITDAQKQSLVEMLRETPMETKDVRAYIEKHFNYSYSEKQVHMILSGLGLKHAKPYPHDYRRPPNADTTFKKNSKMHWIVSKEMNSS